MTSNSVFNGAANFPKHHRNSKCCRENEEGVQKAFQKLPSKLRFSV